MNAITTWTLIIYMSAYKAGGPVAVDGFATEAACRAAAAQVKAAFPQRYDGGVCVQVPRSPR